ncbi:MAG: pyridoxamine 5'-phosphate oxidase [Acidobacteria bacterium]|nr:MAG: pyridoxamine 5'-phosphate oxidase [Acidobacteriota bacterium]
MAGVLRDQATAYMEGHNVMTLATHGPEGVWAAAVFYANDGFTLQFLSAPSSRHSRNIAASPRVAVTIQEDYRGWREIQGIQLEGTCEKLEGQRKSIAVERYRAKFPIVGPDAPPEIARALDKIAWYEVTPERLFFIDNSVKLGHREEIVI